MINTQHCLKGGAHRVYFNTSKMLVENGHEVVFFSTKSDDSIPYRYDYLFPLKVDYRTTSVLDKIKGIKRFIYNKDAENKIAKIINDVKPDIAHVHLFLGALSVSILKALKHSNVPIVHTVHDYRLICPSYLFLDGKNIICEDCINGNYFNCIIKRCSENKLSQSIVLSLEAYYRKIFKNPVDYIDAFIFVSEFIKNIHVRYDNSFEEKSNVLYNFVDIVAQKVERHEKGRYFLYLGRLSREKGVMTLVNSIKNTNHILKIVGDGPLLKSIKNERSENIDCLGYLKGKDLVQVIRDSSYLIVPSEWYENNPMVVLEAYSYGKPVIGANIGGLPEIIINGKTGFLFESGSHVDLHNVLNHVENLTDDEYEVLSANAYEFVQNYFGKKDHYEKLIRIYNKVIN